MALALEGPASATTLAERIGVSVPTFHRMLQRLPPGELLSAGRARRTRHAVRRGLRGRFQDMPVYSVDPSGTAQVLTSLAPLRPQGSWCPLVGSDWPVPDESRDGWWSGLPYPLYDMRPQGYMGRMFARAEHAALEVAPDPQTWSDDDVLHVLSRRGADVSGNLIVGETAYALWQAEGVDHAPLLEPDETAAAYAALAERAVSTGVPGSSAAGEFPKFGARRRAPTFTPSDTPHVLVKFSGADGSAPVRRWADLLVCEHLALDAAARMPGVSVARSRILEFAGRTFLEVERFDRHGLQGRSGLCSLEVVNAALLGEASRDWTQVAQRLQRAGWLSEADVGAVERLWWFGRLIANTDMHAGNLSFRPQAGRFQLSPAYDMLPMLYAPLAGGEVAVAREFAPPLPLPQQRIAWRVAYEAATVFWAAAAGDERIGASFRAVCCANGERLQQMARHA